jgi:hypothetical protein
MFVSISSVRAPDDVQEMCHLGGWVVGLLVIQAEEEAGARVQAGTGVEQLLVVASK